MCFVSILFCVYCVCICLVCRQKSDILDRKRQVFDVDYIIVKAMGGNEENLQLLCGSCNQAKGTKMQEELIVRLKEMKYVV